MAKGTKGFADQLKSFNRDIKHQHTSLVKRVAAEAQRAAYTHTRIDTSRLMSGWTSSVDVPFQGEPKYTAGSKGSTMAEAVQLNESNIEATAKVYTFGRKVFIRNNVPYAVIRETGTASQPPDGMMAFALEAARREMKK